MTWTAAEKQKAGQLARKFVSIEGLCCERCGITEKLHRHHEDYSRPLDVMILCSSCHRVRHGEINRSNPKTFVVPDNFFDGIKGIQRPCGFTNGLWEGFYYDMIHGMDPESLAHVYQKPLSSVYRWRQRLGIKKEAPAEARATDRKHEQPGGSEEFTARGQA